MSPVEIFDFLSRGGVVAFVLFFGWRLLKGDFRLGREYNDKQAQLVKAEAEADRWQKIAFEALHLGDKVTAIVENGK